MSKAVIYTRVSTQEQVSNYSLATQEKVCLDYCARRSIEVVKIFREEGESAKTELRPALQALIAFCKKSAGSQGVEFVVAQSLDRISRDTSSYSHIRRELAGVNVLIRAVNEDFDDSPQGRFLENVLVSAAQLDNDMKSLRVTAGLLARYETGKWSGRPPLGYRKPLNGSHGAPSLEPEPDVAPLIAQTFAYFAEGNHSKADALRYATSIGLRSSRGAPLSPNTFSKMLTAPVYAGRIRINGTVIQFEGDGDFTPIVEEGLFQRVQQILAGKAVPKASYNWDNPDFPLRRIVKCGSCGRSLTGSWSNNGEAKGKREYAYYRCNTAGCKSNISAPELEGAFLDHLAEQSINDAVYALFERIVRDTYAMRHRTAEKALSALLKERKRIKEKEQRLFDALVYDKSIDQTTYLSEKARLSSEAEAVRTAISDHSLPNLDEAALLISGKQMLTDLPGCWQRLNGSSRRRFAAALYPNGLRVNDGKIGTLEKPWYCLLSASTDGSDDPEVPPRGIEPLLPG